MKEFTIEGFAAHLNDLAETMPLVDAELLEQIGVVVEAAAKEKIGHYQDQSGSFETWPLLADSTLRDRTSKGYPADEPGLRSGEMRDSIGHRVTPPVVEIGSDDEHLLWFELGTVKQPPRSILGAAAFEKAPILAAELGKEMQGHLAGTRKAK